MTKVRNTGFRLEKASRFSHLSLERGVRFSFFIYLGRPKRPNHAKCVPPVMQPPGGHCLSSSRRRLCTAQLNDSLENSHSRGLFGCRTASSCQPHRLTASLFRRSVAAGRSTLGDRRTKQKGCQTNRNGTAVPSADAFSAASEACSSSAVVTDLRHARPAGVCRSSVQLPRGALALLLLLPRVAVRAMIPRRAPSLLGAVAASQSESIRTMHHLAPSSLAVFVPPPDLSFLITHSLRGCIAYA